VPLAMNGSASAAVFGHGVHEDGPISTLNVRAARMPEEHGNGDHEQLQVVGLCKASVECLRGQATHEVMAGVKPTS
jgi:hypothetical protein